MHKPRRHKGRPRHHDMNKAEAAQRQAKAARYDSAQPRYSTWTTSTDHPTSCNPAPNATAKSKNVAKGRPAKLRLATSGAKPRSKFRVRISSASSRMLNFFVQCRTLQMAPWLCKTHNLASAKVMPRLERTSNFRSPPQTQTGLTRRQNARSRETS